ncbi:MAG TPA: hypothetical protein VEI02_09895 [Planctomycetota bacterium]|nr:hypothetical protein [Planctomycetota bacterium]
MNGRRRIVGWALAAIAGAAIGQDTRPHRAESRRAVTSEEAREASLDKTIRIVDRADVGGQCRGFAPRVEDDAGDVVTLPANRQAVAIFGNLTARFGFPEINCILRVSDVGTARVVLIRGRPELHYSEEFLSRLGDGSKDWPAYCVFAHEIGHLFGQHLLSGAGATQQEEISADRFAGFALNRLNVPKAEALDAFKKALEEIPSHSGYPSKGTRREAFLSGWMDAEENRRPESRAAATLCASCSGMKLTTRACAACGGAGRVRKPCTACDGGGRGTRACPDCSKGTVTGACKACGGAGKSEETCVACRGSGGVGANCAACGGEGGFTCLLCGGAGTSMCFGCFGHGRVWCPSGGCMACFPTGQHYCGLCSGKGTVPCPPRIVCMTCNGAGGRRPCAPCGGQGKRAVSCRACDGKGRHATTCAGCNGTKTVRGACVACGGEGASPSPCEPCKGLGGVRVPCEACKDR